MEYRLSTWLIAAGQLLTTVFGFLSLNLMFRRFGSLAGWSFEEAALCFSVTYTAFAIAETFARGFDSFSNLVIHGEFDRILLRPRSSIIQVLGARTDITRFGRIIFGIVILCAVIPGAGITWNPLKILTLIMMILGGSAVFTGIFMLGATFCFFTLEGLEVINILSDGGREMASYPLPVYGKWVTRFFTFIIPFGCMNYLPLMYLTGRADSASDFFGPYFYMMMPFIGFVFIFPCVLVWRFGVRHYSSSGS